MIGVTDSVTDRHHEAREVFKREAKDVSKALESNHYSRRLKNMQVYYPETITKLSHAPSTSHAEPRQTQSHQMHASPSHNSELRIIQPTFKILIPPNTADILRENEFNRVKSEQTFREHDLNNRKLLYNKEVGRTAEVSKIICGKAHPTKEMLFPQGANHQQILALTGTLKMPNAHTAPPPVQRTRKWLGDDRGWSK